MRFLRPLVSGCLLTLVLTFARGAELAPLPPGLYAEIGTPHGAVMVELFFEQTPLTVSNFVGLAEGTLGPAPRKPFFDGLRFHRVVPGFVVQGGDPLGTGEGGPGYDFPDEFRPGLSHDAVGVLSMANAGPDTNGSQFFLTLKPVRRLDFLHSVFGRVIRGVELLPRIQQGDAMTVKLHRVGPAAEAFKVDEARFAQLIAATPKHRAAYFDDAQQLLPQSPPRARGFSAKLENVARFTPLRLYVRLYEKRDPADADKKPEEIARQAAETFGVKDSGVVALYFAEKDEWALWVAEPLLARFNPTNQALPDANQAFVAAARERTQAVIAEIAPTLPAESPLTGQQKLKLMTDEIIDGLIGRLLPRPTP